MSDTAIAKASQDRVVRHKLPDRIYHWVMALSVLTLLGTSLLPIMGLKFPWVTIHWIAGLVLTVAVLFHIVRASFWQGLGSMMIWPRDVVNAWRAVRQFFLLPGRAPGKPGKYPLLQQGYHHFVALVILTTIGTGLLMTRKIDTPIWERDPYWLLPDTWAVIYVLHGFATVALVALVMMHIYFAVIPQKYWITRSMFLGWVKWRDYLEHHDPARWVVDGAPAADTQASSGADSESNSATTKAA